MKEKILIAWYAAARAMWENFEDAYNRDDEEDMAEYKEALQYICEAYQEMISYL